MVARETRRGRSRSLQRLRVGSGNGNRDRVLFVLSVVGGGWRSRPVRHGGDGAIASSGEALDASFADELVERGGDGCVAQCGAFSALGYSDGLKAGRPAYDAVAMFKVRNCSAAGGF